MADALGIRIGMPFPVTSSLSFGNFSLNQTTDQFEVIFQAPPGGGATITKLGVRLATITGTTPTYKVSLQGVDASGVPDGTIKGGLSPASATFSPSSLGWSAGTFHWITLDNSYAAASGEYLALVVAYASGTVDASNFAAVSATISNLVTVQFPVAVQNDAGSRGRQTSAPCFGFASASKAYGNPVEASASQNINSGATSEAGAKFTLPAGWADTFQVQGLRLFIGPTLGKTINLKLYQGGNAGDTTVLQDVSFDTDLFQSASTARTAELLFDEASLSALTMGGTYRIAVSTPDASNQSLIGVSVASASDLDAFDGGGQFTLTTRAGGNWTDTATTRLFMGLLMADITEPAGGGGGGYGRSRVVNVGG